MNMRVLIIICVLLIVGMISCMQASKDNGDNANNIEEVILDSTLLRQKIQADLSRYDTLLSSGYYVHYVLNDSFELSIHWGKDTMDNAMHYGDYEDIYIWYEVEYENYIGMRSSCGSPCWGLWLLPKEDRDSILRYDYPILHDTSRNWMLWREAAYGEEFLVSNIETGECQQIILDDFPEFGFFLDGLDSMAFVKEGLFMRWKTRLDFSDDAPTQEQVFRLNFKKY